MSTSLLHMGIWSTLSLLGVSLCCYTCCEFTGAVVLLCLKDTALSPLLPFSVLPSPLLKISLSLGRVQCSIVVPLRAEQSTAFLSLHFGQCGSLWSSQSTANSNFLRRGFKYLFRFAFLRLLEMLTRVLCICWSLILLRILVRELCST